MAWVSWGEHADGAAEHNAASESRYTDRWRIGGAEVRDVVEKVVRKVWAKMEAVELPEHFRVMCYDEAMARYGSDKPDLRFGLEVCSLLSAQWIILTTVRQIEDITAHLPEGLRDALDQRGEIVEALCVRAADPSFLNAAKQLDSSETRLMVRATSPGSIEYI